MVLRHDVDKRPQNSLAFAQFQKELGVRGTYYFRIKPESFDPRIIEQIAEMGHEIGYHYEDVTLAARAMKKEKGTGRREKGKADGSPESGVRKSRVGEKFEDELLERGIKSFERNLARLRQLADIKTICMHGSPLSRWDSRLLWERYDYRDYGLIGEPYFDVDFETTAYYTDTGRRWDGEKVSVRDKPMEKKVEKGKGKKEKGTAEKSPPSPFSFLPAPTIDFPSFHSTFDIIQALERGEFPDRAMLTFHPQRWTDRPVLWTRELVEQNIKNVVKKMVVQHNKKS